MRASFVMRDFHFETTNDIVRFLEIVARYLADKERTVSHVSLTEARSRVLGLLVEII
jgi:hypothetical protein